MIYISTTSGLPLAESIADLVPREMSHLGIKLRPHEKIYGDGPDGSVLVHVGTLIDGDSKYDLTLSREFFTPGEAKSETPFYQGKFSLSRLSGDKRLELSNKNLSSREIEMIRELGISIANRSDSIDKIVSVYRVASDSQLQIEVYSPLRF
ncbi:MAG TPA: hypothetical protein VI564_00440 [Candidatus Nanoarchaeia archaeon]|nr:hypothetical protein [Candidatus Nanoarchaeia archaeon]